MAAVLGYGSDLVQPGSMQSFFRPVPSNTDGTQDHPRAAPQPHGLDGSADQVRPDFPDRPLLDDVRSSSRNLDVGQVNNVPARSQWDGCNDNDTLHDSIEVDPNSNRRKRRKLTPIKAQSTLGGQNIIVYAKNAEKGSTNAVTAAPTQGSGNAGSPTLTTSVAPELHLVQDTSPQTPKKRTPRKKQQRLQVDLTDHAESVTPEEGNTSIKSASSKNAKSTSRKKTLSLHTNGKLLSSPQEKPEATKASASEMTITKPETKPTAARQFKMKNGKFVQTLEVTLKYGSNEERRKDLASRIDAILLSPSVRSDHQAESSKSHPFFTSKRKSKLTTGDGETVHGDCSDTNGDFRSQKTEPVAWKDIKFTTRKPPVGLRPSESIRPVWPPLALQHVGMDPLPQATVTTPDQVLSSAKHKTKLMHLPEDENVLLSYHRGLKISDLGADAVGTPQRRHLTGLEVANNLSASLASSDHHAAVLSVRSELISGSTAFDRGECAGPNIWPVQYAPNRWSEVLQPSVLTFHTWLQSLAIHNVQSGTDPAGKKQKQRSQIKKKRRKPKSELDDFIVGSDDDDLDSGKTIKTALLIVGPHGCGKTASVFAVAKELGFEVFEIHPGMRRSAKDIFDKVGDMAHNHLVQKGSGHSRSSSVALSEASYPADTEVVASQTGVANFFSTKPSLKPKAVEDKISRHIRREQKQSLILFEEVDLLFDDDKAFWTGVQNLINNSKRPVVLTCNDPNSIPIDDLDLFDILDYAAVDVDLAVDYLTHIAAAEGHILDRKALVTLYESKGKDLRASITELNFWCQMTVGSRHGGLDWMGQTLTPGVPATQTDQQLRTFSQHTFHESLDLRPQNIPDEVAAMEFNRETLGIPTTEWCDFADSPQSKFLESCRGSIEALERLSLITEARSACDLFEAEGASFLASTITTICATAHRVLDCHELSQRYLRQFQTRSANRKDFVNVLEPIMTEKPTFPPSQGRLAPSIDTPASSLVTDIAPYVRFITRFDAQTEQHRDEMFGSQGNARTTRAARAAAEGGDKATTRTERWFPKGLDFDRVLQTAGTWPQWYDKAYGNGVHVDTTDVEWSADISLMDQQ